MYPWQFLTYHLRQAGRGHTLGALLTNPDWLHARLTRFSIQALLADYREAKSDSGLRLVRNALVLSSRILARDPSALTGQLAGRLLYFDDPRIQSLVHRKPTPLAEHAMLLPAFGVLTPPSRATRVALQKDEKQLVETLSVAVLPDGRRGLSGGPAGDLTLWDLEEGTVIRTMRGRQRGARTVAALSDNHQALSGSETGMLTLWNVDTGMAVRRFEGHAGGVTSVAVLQDDRRALSAGQDESVRLWDLGTGTMLRSFQGHDELVTAVAADRGMRNIVSGSHNGTLKVWDLATGTLLHTFTGHDGRVTAVSIFPDGTHALSASRDGTLRMWNLLTYSPVEVLGAHAARVTAVAVLPDGRRALSGSEDRTLKVWDIALHAVLCTFHDEVPVTSAAVGPNLRVIAGNSYGGICILQIA